MNIQLAKRFYYTDEASLQALEGMLDRLPPFIEANRNTGDHITLSFNISANEEKLGTEQRERGKTARENMIELGIPVCYDGASRTAGTKLIHALFETEPSEDARDPLLGIACFDQFPLDQEKYLAAIYELGKKVVQDQTLYAAGSRNVPVVLGVNKIPSDMRVIHELVQLLATESEAFRAEKPAWATPSTYYQHFGEFTSGLFLINPAHPRYNDLQRKVFAQKPLFEKPGFAIEYTTALHAGLAGAVSSGYIYAEKNPFYATIAEGEEKARVSRFIVAQTGAVGKTWVRPALERILRPQGESVDATKISHLYDHFDKSVVDETVALMRQGIYTK